jgi:hypothetical protein
VRAANPASAARTWGVANRVLLSDTTTGIPRTSRSRRPDRLAITVVPKITLTPEAVKPRKIPFLLLPNFLGFSQIF